MAGRTLCRKIILAARRTGNFDDNENWAIAATGNSALVSKGII